MNEADVQRPRLRRSSEEIRGLLHEAATMFFARNGYAGTSTRAIAMEAGVSETLLFRHFGTKSGLFAATTLHGLRAGVEKFVEPWRERSPEPGAEEAHAREFLGGLLRFFREQRGVMFALLTVDAAGDDDIRSIQAHAVESVGRILAAIERHVLTRADGQLYPGVDPKLTASSVAAALMAVTVLDDWLFRSDAERPAVEEIDDEVISYVLDGVGYRR